MGKIELARRIGRGAERDQKNRLYIVPVRIVNVVAISPRFRELPVERRTLALSHEGIERS